MEENGKEEKENEQRVKDGEKETGQFGYCLEGKLCTDRGSLNHVVCVLLLL